MSSAKALKHAETGRCRAGSIFDSKDAVPLDTHHVLFATKGTHERHILRQALQGSKANIVFCFTRGTNDESTRTCRRGRCS